MDHAESRDIVLVADDDPTFLRLVYLFLEGEPIEIVVAQDGATAIELALGSAPDLILLDMLMPGMSGIDACRRLQEEQATWDVPVILMTALRDASTRMAAFEAGAADYITKPIEKVELLARVRTQLSTRRELKALRARVEELTRENERLTRELGELSRRGA